MLDQVTSSAHWIFCSRSNSKSIKFLQQFPNWDKIRVPRRWEKEKRKKAQALELRQLDQFVSSAEWIFCHRKRSVSMGVLKRYYNEIYAKERRQKRLHMPRYNEWLRVYERDTEESIVVMIRLLLWSRQERLEEQMLPTGHLWLEEFFLFRDLWNRHWCHSWS